MMTDDRTTTSAEVSMSDDAREQLVAELVNRAHAEGVWEGGASHLRHMEGLWTLCDHI